MPTPQIIIDTNVVIAGLRSRNGSAFRLLELVGGEQFNPSFRTASIGVRGGIAKAATKPVRQCYRNSELY